MALNPLALILLKNNQLMGTPALMNKRRVGQSITPSTLSGSADTLSLKIMNYEKFIDVVIKSNFFKLTYNVSLWGRVKTRIKQKSGLLRFKISRAQYNPKVHPKTQSN